VCVSLVGDAGSVDASATVDAVAIDAGPPNCSGPWGAGALVVPPSGTMPDDTSPAVTGDEYEIFFVQGNVGGGGYFFVSARTDTSTLFGARRGLPELDALCTGSTNAYRSIDVSDDGLRVYVACGGQLLAAHRADRLPTTMFVSDGVVAMPVSPLPTVVAGELVLYDDDGTTMTMSRATRSSTSVPFGTAMTIAELSGMTLTAPDLTPDGLMIMGDDRNSSGEYAIFAYTRATPSGVFDIASRSMVNLPGTAQTAQPEVSPSCRSLYYVNFMTGATTGVHPEIWVSHR
jgi:hypothetical protein